MSGIGSVNPNLAHMASHAVSQATSHKTKAAAGTEARETPAAERAEPPQQQAAEGEAGGRINTYA